MAAPNAVAIVAVPMAANPWMDLNAARGLSGTPNILLGAKVQIFAFCFFPAL
jgi:hypothetical protein